MTEELQSARSAGGPCKNRLRKLQHDWSSRLVECSAGKNGPPSPISAQTSTMFFYVQIGPALVLRLALCFSLDNRMRKTPNAELPVNHVPARGGVARVATVSCRHSRVEVDCENRHHSLPRCGHGAVAVQLRRARPLGVARCKL